MAAETFFEDLIALGIPRDVDTNQWLLDKFMTDASTCTIDDFTIFYLNLIKTQTDEFIRSNTSTCTTPRKPLLSLCLDNQEITPVEKNESKNNVAEVKRIAYKRQSSRDLFGSTAVNVSNEPAGNFNDSNLNFKNNSSINETSTPVLNHKKSLLNTSEIATSTPKFASNSRNNSLSFEKSSTTFRHHSKNSLDFSSRNNSVNKKNSSSPMCFGDFLNSSSNSNHGKSTSRRKQDSGHHQTLNFSKEEFPSLGGDTPVTTTGMKKEKPKKRVVPLTVSRKCTSDGQSFVSSSFQSDNNLLEVTPSDAIDTMSERKMLCEKREMITNDFKMEKEPEKNLHTIIKENLSSMNTPVKSQNLQSAIFEFDESKLTRKELLIVLAQIYSFILDMNLVSNVLSEFSYLFNLLNADYDPFENLEICQNASIIDTSKCILKSLNNCIYFVINILKYQKWTLASLDAMTIRVILDNERIQAIAIDLHEFLKSNLQLKNQLNIVKVHNKSANNFVFFQQETDNIDNFPSSREFSAFRKQRDMFYEVLRTWETKHLDPTWDFRRVIGTKISSLILIMEHPINMAHLARLFTSQIIISCNFDDNELQMVLPNIDLGKLSKLRQRLTAPSAFSAQYLFPGTQAFFRDFIMCCDHHLIFIEQLKISMISELLQMNDSSMETICISPGYDDRGDEDINEQEKSFKEEFIVLPETMTTMRILAKFIGFIVSRPYIYEGYRNTIVDQKQSQIRNSLHPDFDVKKVLIRAMNGSKILVTIPWLVEYLAMLDFVTIRLDYYRELFQTLYSIYTRVNMVKNHDGSLCALPTSNFIIRTCLGWLFDHADIPEDYHSVSNMKNALKSVIEIENKTESSVGTDMLQKMHPHLENVLTAACPFLADLRISMMPQRVTKVVSRTGRYRHITTKFQDKKQVESKVQDGRVGLIEAFLASQTPSVRKTVDFVIDRTTSAVVKDFQVKHLIKIRRDAKAECEKVAETVENVERLAKEMTRIFCEFLMKLHDKWNCDVNENCQKRICGAFESLMPFEMLDEVKNRLIAITYERTRTKLEEWKVANISTITIFSKDIKSDATKTFVERKSHNEGKKMSSSLVINMSLGCVMPSEMLKLLQRIIHMASLYPMCLKMEELLEVFDMAADVVDKQFLPSSNNRNIAYFLLQLLVLLIFNRSEYATQELKAKFFELCKNEKIQPFTNVRAAKNGGGDFLFSHLITPRLFITYRGRSRTSFELYANFLIEIARENFTTIDQIIEQSVQLYQHEWSKDSLNDIAFLVDHLKSSLSSHETPAESQLFLDLVSQLAKDMENF